MTRAASLTEFNVNSEQETLALGQKIAACLRKGSVVSIQGELGSGKTRLVKGVALGLGVEEPVTSPTYTIINEYSITKGGCKDKVLRHMDVYRISGDDFAELGGTELICGDDISLIEWGERLEKKLPADAIRVFINITGVSSRNIRLEGLDIK